MAEPSFQRDTRIEKWPTPFFKEGSRFSKMSKDEKINSILEHSLGHGPHLTRYKKLLESFWHEDSQEQKNFDQLSENTLSNFYFPFGVCPQVFINGKDYCVPMVIEESSVVAAASKASKFWLKRGGFKAEVLSTQKVGQVHLIWSADPLVLKKFFKDRQESLRKELSSLLSNMEKRGGGLTEMKLVDKTHDEPGYFQIQCQFETCQAMGANFINTVLEALAQNLKEQVAQHFSFQKDKSPLEIIMAILSNYTPQCLVEASVECLVEELGECSGMSPREWAKKFERAVGISKVDIHRATTHNKGIFNGIDAVVIATGNDFRAVEACGHTFAARDGQYRGLSDCSLHGDLFSFRLKIPLALGTVGGLTSLHPLAKFSLELLGNPSSSRLMEIAAVMGLAQNFAAIRSLVTTGIQKGHMKMHLFNILNHLEASQEERIKAMEYFGDKTISFKSVSDYLKRLRVYC